jgi:thiol-disulfide isomerase/thioredoxin
MRSPPIAVLLALVAFATQASAEATLKGVDLGRHVLGPKAATGDLQGKVVLFEYWGVHCPPCCASIPHLAEFQKKYGRDNFVIIANHCQGDGDEAVASMWSGRGGGTEVTVVNDGRLPGSNVSGIPRCFLFDHEGKLVFDGSPFDVEEKLKTAMAASPGALVVGHDFAKLGKQAAAIGAMKGNLAGTIKAIRTAAAGPDADAKGDADFLLERLSTYAVGRLDSIRGSRTDDPAGAMEALSRAVSLFKGDELGKPFEDLVKELKADKAFQTELKAAGALAAVQAQAAKIGLGSDPSAKNRKQAVAEILANLQTLQKQFAGTCAADKAGRLAQSWGL